MNARLGLRALTLSALLALFAPTAAAELKLARIFSDHMVVQRDQPVPVWGWAEPGYPVNINLGLQARNAIANEEGEWSVTFDPLPPQGPHTLGVASNGEVLIVSDVLVGQVWMCSGQSNMSLPVSFTPNAAQEAVAAETLASIRCFTVEAVAAERPVDDVQGEWAVCDPETVLDFPALAFAYGRELNAALQEPIGLIVAAVGATAAEVWASRGAIAREPTLTRLHELLDYPVDPDARPELPGVLFNGMVAPLIPYSIAGFIWYQGESNFQRGYEYRTLFPVLVRDWRARWQMGDLPFYYVQIAPYDYPGDDRLGDSFTAELREAQVLSHATLPATGMVVSMDVADPTDIHSPDKRIVGRRLSTWALTHTYAMPRPHSGPLYTGIVVQNHMVHVLFDFAQGGLATSDGQAPSDFLIAGEDGVFYPAETVVYWDRVVAWNANVFEPVAVRYAWDDDVVPNLVNAFTGLPASPFRSDDWPGMSGGGSEPR